MGKDESSQQILLDSIETLSETKALAENRVKLLRALVADKELSADELRPIQGRYSDARARVNASFDRLLVELEVAGKTESAEPISKLANRAAEEMTGFIEASDAVILGDDRSGIGAAAIGAGPGFVGALVDVWKTLRGEKKQKHAALIGRIESLKWEPFDEIK